MREFLLALLLVGAADAVGHGLVSPQSDCKIRCENGGMCVFDLDMPDVHSCICLLGVFHGDRCQFAVEQTTTEVTTTTSPTSRTETPIQVDYRQIHQQQPSQNVHPQNQPQNQVHHQNSHTSTHHYHRGHRVDDEREQEEERKKAYERKLVEQRHKERLEEHRKQEERRRSDAAREDALRAETHRRRHEEHLAQQRRDQERLEADRRRAEEARRAETERQEAERRRKEEERRQSEEQRRRLEDSQKEAEIVPEVSVEQRQEAETKEKEAEMANEDWDYKNNEEDDDYLNVPELEEHMEHSEDEQASVQVQTTTGTTPEHQAEVDWKPDSKSDSDILAGLNSVLEKAVEETLQEHPVEETAEENNSDDYWDHTPKRTDEDYALDAEIQNIGASEVSEKATDPPQETEYGMEEGQEGWMMVRAEKDTSMTSSCSRWLVLAVFFGLARSLSEYQSSCLNHLLSRTAFISYAITEPAATGELSPVGGLSGAQSALMSANEFAISRHFNPGFGRRFVDTLFTPQFSSNRRIGSACLRDKRLEVRNGCEKMPGVVAKRNARERTRVHTVNQAFQFLKEHLPTLRQHTKRVSKLKILNAAINYIDALLHIIESTDGVPPPKMLAKLRLPFGPPTTNACVAADAPLVHPPAPEAPLLPSFSMQPVPYVKTLFDYPTYLYPPPPTCPTSTFAVNSQFMMPYQ
ncbi:unnamed protein product [Caenorhabditis auriculariae]|uniref:BHLH domain-containing protein n=1 Tax=Caenorhabditis auriculariae TaxID=2777116 RepID=A0A8S1GYN4_9PELO|nr:unnamed protein product [Caenorhabditis auriculariae]